MLLAWMSQPIHKINGYRLFHFTHNGFFTLNGMIDFMIAMYSIPTRLTGDNYLRAHIQKNRHDFHDEINGVVGCRVNRCFGYYQVEILIVLGHFCR